MKYGLLLNNSFNIGDDIQSIASMRFLPKIDEYIFKEKMNLFSSVRHEKTKVILNSWYMWKYDNFPPSEDIIPLMISMHFSGLCREKFDNNARVMDYLKEKAPIGCRDIKTAEWLTNKGIPAYFSGCLTLTLVENPELRNLGGRYILCVDVPEYIVKKVKERFNNYNIIVLNKNIFGTYYAKDRLEIAKMFLYAYHNAKAVVTGNLHVSLPSLAFNTPVCLLNDVNTGPDVEDRFSGIRQWFHNFSTEEFINNDVFDFNNPPCNPTIYLKYKKQLIESCKQFTGYDRNRPTLDNFDPSDALFKMLQFSHYNMEKNYKGLLASPLQQLLKAYEEITINKIDKHSIDY